MITKSDAGSFRELGRVALPLILSSGSISLMHVIDRMYLTWFDTAAVGAAFQAGVLFWTLYSLLLGTVMYVNTFVAQYDGAKKPQRVVAAVWQGIYLAIIGGAVIMAIAPFSDRIFATIGHEASIQHLESSYFAICCMGGIPMALAACLSCFFTGRGHTKVVMYVNFTVLSINAVLDYLMIFGFGGFPEMGVRGAAIATMFSQCCAVAIYAKLVIGARHKEGYDTLKNWQYDGELFRRILRYGLPTGFQYLGEISGITIFISLVGTIGSNELTATSLAFNLNSMAFIPMLGFGTAVMTLVGRRIGEGRPEMAVRTTWIAAAFCCAYMLFFSAIYLFQPDAIIWIYSIGSDPEKFAPIRDLIVLLLKFVAVYSFFDGLAIIFSSAIRGAGDTRFALIFTIADAWILMVIPVVVVWKFYEPNLLLGWAAVAVYIMVLGLGFFWRFHKGAWKSMRVIEHTANVETEPVENVPHLLDGDVLPVPVVESAGEVTP